METVSYKFKSNFKRKIYSSSPAFFIFRICFDKINAKSPPNNPNMLAIIPVIKPAKNRSPDKFAPESMNMNDMRFNTPKNKTVRPESFKSLFFPFLILCADKITINAITSNTYPVDAPEYE